MIDIFKNPIIIGLLAGTLTYLYMWWSNEDKYKKNPEMKRTTGIITPLVVTVISWILAYGYYEMSGNNIGTALPIHEVNSINLGDTKMYKFGRDNAPAVASESAKEFHLIGKGLNIPNNLKLPDVFIETM